MRKTIGIWLSIALTVFLLTSCFSQAKKLTVIPKHNGIDVAVIGTELEGMYLARAAKDEGLNVVILDPRDGIGGQLIQGQMLYLDEPHDRSGKSLLQGKVKELFDGYQSGKIRKISDFKDYFNSLIKDIPIETGITIKNLQSDPVENGVKITQITYQTKDGKEKQIKATYWVENTDFNALTSKLKVTKIPGIETVFKESAPDYMAASMMLSFKNVDWKAFKQDYESLTREERVNKFGAETYINNVTAYGFANIVRNFKSSNSRIFLRGLNALNQNDGHVLVNALLIYGVDPANNSSVQEALDMGKKEFPMVLEHLKKNLPGWENAQINEYPPYLYIRDYNRFETDYVLQASDELGAKTFWDNVSIAGYPIDLQGTLSNKWGTRIGVPDKYGMPLRSFLLKNYNNVFVVGKNVGASAVAYGSARIQANTSLAAETIGIILGQIYNKKNIKNLTEDDMNNIHQYIESHYHIKLTGIRGTNEIQNLTDQEIKNLNIGKYILH
jgi:hypothetical protein